jgi:hypothetical protein
VGNIREKSSLTRVLGFGTMAAHPRTFIVIGLLRSGVDPEELARQGELF